MKIDIDIIKMDYIFRNFTHEFSFRHIVSIEIALVAMKSHWTTTISVSSRSEWNIISEHERFSWIIVVVRKDFTLTSAIWWNNPSFAKLDNLLIICIIYLLNIDIVYSR